VEASQIYSGAGDPEIAARERPVMSMSGNHGHGLFKVFTVKNTIGRCHQGHQLYWQRQFNWVGTSCPAAAAAATRTPGGPPPRPQPWPEMITPQRLAPSTKTRRFLCPRGLYTMCASVAWSGQQWHPLRWGRDSSAFVRIL